MKTFTIVGVLALVLVAPRMEAQTGSRVKFGAAFGPGWETRGAGGPSGTHFSISATLRPRSSMFSYRLETMLDDSERAQRAATSRDLHRHATFALTASAIRRLAGTNTGPYAIAGVGLYHQWNELIRGATPEGEQSQRGIWANARFGVSAGLGYTFTAMKQELFMEGRYHTTGFESRVPISLGIRI